MKSHKKKHNITKIHKWTMLWSRSWSWAILFIAVALLIASRVFGFSYKEGLENNNNINYLDGIDIIYWINLDRSTDRRYNMESLFKDDAFKDIPQQRIVAFDGKSNPESVIDKLSFIHKRNSDTEYACLLSHLETIRAFDNSSHNVALIFEDDVTLEFKKYWKKSVKEIISNAPQDWEIIMLSWIYDFNKNVLFDDWNDSQANYDKNNDKYYSTLSYLINKKGSNKIMQTYTKNKYVLKNNLVPVADVYLYQTLNTYVYKYPMFIYKSDNDSLIHANHLNLHLKSKNKIVELYDNMLVK